MKKYEVTNIVDGVRVLHFKELAHLDVRKAKDVSGLEAYPYTVNINMNNVTYQFNDETRKFYVAYSDDARMEQQQKGHEDLVEGLDPQKDAEEIKDRLRGKYVEYVELQEFVIDIDGVDVAQKVADLIKKYSV